MQWLSSFEVPPERANKPYGTDLLAYVKMIPYWNYVYKLMSKLHKQKIFGSLPWERNEVWPKVRCLGVMDITQSNKTPHFIEEMFEGPKEGNAVFTRDIITVPG